MRATVLASTLLCAAGLAAGQTREYDILISGAKVGSSTFVVGKDGFQSETSLDVGKISIRSKFVGSFAGGKLVAFEFEESAGAKSGKVSYANQHVTVVSDGKTAMDKAKMDLDSSAVLATYHPGLLGTVFEAARTDKTRVSALIPNALRHFDVDLSRKVRIAELPTGKVPVVSLETTLQGIRLEFAFAEDGTPLGMSVPTQGALFVLRGWEAAFVDPLKAYPELSQPTFQIVTEPKVAMKLKSGAELVQTVVRPKDDARHPTILVRTPYGRGASALQGELFARRGYAFVTQDTRGRGDSGGTFDPFNTEVEDGRETLDWVISQPWSDGSVGMIGGSYLALVQWAAAVTHHPALKCIVPQVSPPDPTRNIPWDHGAFMLAGSVWWSRVVAEKDADLVGAMNDLKGVDKLLTTPLSRVDEAMFKRQVGFFDNWLVRESLDRWKGAYRLDQIGTVKIPVLHISGVWDGDAIGTKLHWEALRRSGGQQWLVYGPWEHAFNVKTKFGDQNYGPNSVLELDSLYLRFFDTFLKGREVGWANTPKSRVFVTGLNGWLNGPDWPLPGARPASLYLQKGALRGTPGVAQPVRYRYDPNKVRFDQEELKVDSENATTLIGDDHVGAHYASAPFERDTIVTGPVQVELFVSTTARDATFHAFVMDEDPTGVRRIVGQPGTMRVGWGQSHFRKLTPGQVYPITIQPWEFAHLFKAGHKLVLAVESDLFPRFARNPGTGESEATATRMRAATHTVYGDKRYPSRVTFHKIVME